MFSSLNSANSKWRRVGEDTGIVGKEVILDEKGNTEEQNDCGKNHKRIYLESRIFQSWLMTKFDAGYESCSDSDFTVQLLIVEGKLCLHNSFDLYTVNDVFYLHKYLCVLL